MTSVGYTNVAIIVITYINTMIVTNIDDGLELGSDNTSGNRSEAVENMSVVRIAQYPTELRPPKPSGWSGSIFISYSVISRISLMVVIGPTNPCPSTVPT
jgi:hypothetical protein